MNRIDRFILVRMVAITTLVLAGLIFVFIIIDFSENSDDFADRGATAAEIWYLYYLNYIPEIIRLVLPVAVFAACLLLTAKMAQRMEIISLKAAGVSLYRLLVPYLLFAIGCTAFVSYLDGYVVPPANQERIEFERNYLMSRSDRIDRSRIYRQESPNTLMVVNFYAPSEATAYRVNLYTFENDRLSRTLDASRMTWNEEGGHWVVHNVLMRHYHETGYDEWRVQQADTTLSILPRDLARTTSDIYQLTYPEAFEYIASMKRVGASEIELPKVQLYGKIFYSFSIIVITILGVSIASVRRAGGTGFTLGLGLAVSFLYLATMKLIEPFGAAGVIDPMWAAAIPHLLFFVVAVVTLIRAHK